MGNDGILGRVESGGGMEKNHYWYKRFSGQTKYNRPFGDLGKGSEESAANSDWHATVRNQEHPLLAPHLHLSANLSYFRFIWPFKSHTISGLFSHLVILSPTSDEWMYFEPFYGRYWTSASKRRSLGLSINRPYFKLEWKHAMKWLKIHSQMGRRTARRLNNPEGTLNILNKYHVTLKMCK